MNKTVGRKSVARAFLLACVAAAAGTAAFAEQPDKWVRYVEATGTQYIDTGVRARWGTKAEMKVEWMQLADTAFLDARISGGNRLYFCHCSASGEVLQGVRSYNYYSYSDSWRARFELNRVFTVVNEFTSPDANNMMTNIVSVDGVSLNCIDGGGTPLSMAHEKLDVGYSIYLFACNASGSPTSYSKSRCYGLKIWQDGSLVRDFQPCIKDGRAGLYDDVSKTIFYSGSSTDLVCDENSEEPDEYIDYVESTGNAAFSYVDRQNPSYVDTGIIGRPGTKIVGEFAMLANEDGAILGSRKGNDRFYMVHSYYTKFTCGYGTHKSNNTTLELGKRYWVETEFNVGKQVEKVWADGEAETVLYSGTDGTSVNTGYPMYLFTCDVDGNPYLNQTSAMSAKARCYGLKIWQDGSLVRDFRPCLKNGVAGLYDDVSKRIFYSSGTPLNFQHTKSVREKDVVFVDYIESDGNNTLDTCVPALSGLRARGEMAWMGPKHDSTPTIMREWEHESKRYIENIPAVFYRQQHAYLAATSISGKRLFMVHSNNRYLDFAYGTGDAIVPKSGGSNIAPIIGTRYSFDATLANGSQTFEWDGAQVISTNIAGNVDTGDTLHVFSSSFWRHRSMARCYGLEIYEGDTKVRDFKPCVYEGKGMLYDTVTGKVYRPSPDIPLARVGNAVPTGEEKPAVLVDYVESDGTQFINTCVTGRYDTVAEFEMAWRCTPDAAPMTYERSFLGSRGSGDTRIFTFFTSYGRLAYGYGNYRYVKADDPTNWTAWNVGPFWYVGTNKVCHAKVSFSSSAQVIQVSTNGVMETLQNITSYNSAIDSQLPMYLFAANIADAPTSSSDVRLYWLKIWQDGNLVRNFKPVRLKGSGVVALWDFVEDKPYFPQSVSSPVYYKDFSAVGPDGAQALPGTRLIVR
ncbi:MAG: hypothetical protein IKE55_07250 [Kiritimatiellae bacterium]|nr:hypothetical protein [Kiritimatiellia bacterium]